MTTPRKNIIRCTAAVLLSTTLGTLSAHAELIAADSFDSYADAADLNGQTGGTGWNGAWSVPTATANAAIISDQEITYNFGGTTLGGGNSLLINNGSNPLQRDVFATPDTSGQDYYVSFIFNNTESTFVGWQAKDGDVDVGNDTIGLTNTNNTVAARVGGTNNTATGPISFVNGTTHFVVIGYTGWDGATYRTANIWLNPTSGVEPGESVSASYTGAVGEGSSGFMGLYIRTVSFTTGTEFMYIDDLRVGTDWESVTAVAIPEPGSTALLAAGAAALFALAGRRRRA
ncbi:MAG: PEP-CTERM sorting domain-containing protein [Verrucomicrobiota bacterium]